MECVVQEKLFMLSGYYIAAIVFFAAVAVFQKARGATALLLLTAVFYSLSIFLHCEIKAVQISNFRYLAWTALDVLYLCTVYYALFRRKKLKIYIFAALLLVHIFSWILHLVRIVDINFFESFDVSFLYGVGIAVYNFLVVAIMAMTILPSSKSKTGVMLDDGFSIGGSDRSDIGRFSARIKVSK